MPTIGAVESWPTIGQQRLFGWLLVLEHSGRDERKHYYRCMCKCGKVLEVRADRLVYGRQKSCGCMRANPDVRRAARMTIPPERRAEIASMGAAERNAEITREEIDEAAAARRAFYARRCPQRRCQCRAYNAAYARTIGHICPLPTPGGPR